MIEVIRAVAELQAFCESLCISFEALLRTCLAEDLVVLKAFAPQTKVRLDVEGCHLFARPVSLTGRTSAGTSPFAELRNNGKSWRSWNGVSRIGTVGGRGPCLARTSDDNRYFHAHFSWEEAFMVMKKLINDPANITAELLEGFALAYADKVKLESGKLVVRTQPEAADKVAWSPWAGRPRTGPERFVGEGMLDISVVGDIFAAPAAPKVFEALKKANRAAGVLLVMLNHAGDVMSANIAMEMAKKQGLNFRTLLTHEDIAPGANAPASRTPRIGRLHSAL